MRQPTVAPKTRQTAAVSALLLCAAALLPARVHASFAFGSAASQDPLPACRQQVLCNGEFCADVCADGSLAADSWLTRAIRFQYNLTRSRSWRLGPILGTHNGFISRANGFGLTEDLASHLYASTRSALDASHVRVPNQRFGPKDLLSLGVRELELDLWDTLVDNDRFAVVVCHSPVPEPQAVVELQAAATAVGLGALRYNPFDELCSNKTVTWAFTQVREWLDANADDVVEIFLDNRVATWNAGDIAAAATAVFGASLLTPGDLARTFNGSWPSRDAMLARGKRVIIESNSYAGNNYTNTTLPSVAFWPTTWTDQPGVLDFAPAPNCTLHGTDAWYGSGLPRLLDSGDLEWRPEEDGEKGIVLKPAGLADLANCAVNNVGLADVTPAALTGWVWSWAAGEPAALPPPAACAAAAMTAVRGTWRAVDCAVPLRALCRLGSADVPSGGTPGAWRVTANAVTFDAAAAACAAEGAGFAFDLPRDGRENQLVARRLLVGGDWERGLQGVWLNSRTQ